MLTDTVYVAEKNKHNINKINCVDWNIGHPDLMRDVLTVAGDWN